jgi:hypothetical protein
MADIAVVVLLGAALWIALIGGGRYLVFDVVISMRSPRVFLYAAASLAIVRHLLWPRPTALTRARYVYASILARAELAAAIRAFVATRPAVLLVGFFAVITFGLSDKAGFSPSRDRSQTFRRDTTPAGTPTSRSTGTRGTTRSSPVCGRRAIDGTALLDAFPALSGARGGPSAPQRPRLGRRLWNRAGPVRGPLLHVARAVLTDSEQLRLVSP